MINYYLCFCAVLRVTVFFCVFGCCYSCHVERFWSVRRTTAENKKVVSYCLHVLRRRPPSVYEKITLWRIENSHCRGCRWLESVCCKCATHMPENFFFCPLLGGLGLMRIRPAMSSGGGREGDGAKEAVAVVVACALFVFWVRSNGRTAVVAAVSRREEPPRRRRCFAIHYCVIMFASTLSIVPYGTWFRQGYVDEKQRRVGHRGGLQIAMAGCVLGPWGKKWSVKSHMP